MIKVVLAAEGIMKKLSLFPILALILTIPAGTGTQALLALPPASELIKALDANQVFETEIFSARMTIVKSGRKLIKDFNGYGKRIGQQFFMAFTNPEDKGVKYLRIADELWIYLPDAQDSLKISGHMLRQGMMGSDLSYEDMLKNEKLNDQYQADITGSTNIRGIDCLRLILTAKVEDATYYQRVCYVDPSTMLLHEAELRAKSGRLLKRMTFSGFKQVSGRTFAEHFSIRDMTRAGSETSIDFLSISFDQPLPTDAFARSRLSK
jgi:outer membrane lipoprotein-sorting protein